VVVVAEVNVEKLRFLEVEENLRLIISSTYLRKNKFSLLVNLTFSDRKHRKLTHSDQCTRVKFLLDVIPSMIP